MLKFARFLERTLSGRKFNDLRKSINDLNKLGLRADVDTLSKASSNNFLERHREILSDPLNLLINRVAQAGYIDEHGNVFLHNGNKVPTVGPYAYYRDFSDILILNRGVHEPLEEFCFQTVLANLATKNEAPRMLELGAYWGHYSMWLKSKFPHGCVTMVEPEALNLRAGQHNFALNNLEGTFIQNFVGKEHFSVDAYMRHSGMSELTILHADIQGFEVEMLKDCVETLARGAITYVFISTHSKELHDACLREINSHRYRVEVNSEPDHHSTSFDGFILATVGHEHSIFNGFKPLGRIDIAQRSGVQLASYLADTLNEKIEELAI